MERIEQEISSILALLDKPESELKPSEQLQVQTASTRFAALFEAVRRRAEHERKLEDIRRQTEEIEKQTEDIKRQAERDQAMYKEADYKRKIEILELEKKALQADQERKLKMDKVDGAFRQLELKDAILGNMKIQMEHSVTEIVKVGKHADILSCSGTGTIVNADEVLTASELLRSDDAFQHVFKQTDEEVCKKLFENSRDRAFIFQYRMLKLLEALGRCNVSSHVNCVSRPEICIYSHESHLNLNMISCGVFMLQFFNNEEEEYHAALGCMLDKFDEMKKFQPLRTTCYGFIAGYKRLHLFKQVGEMVFKSEKFDFDFKKDNKGLHHLLALYRRSDSELGYLDRFEMLEFTPIGPNVSLARFEPIYIRSPKSKIFSGWDLDNKDRYVIKIHASHSDRQVEIDNLKTLHLKEIKHVPQLVSVARVSVRDGDIVSNQTAIVMKPYGQHLNASELSYKEFIGCLIEIVNTMQEAHDKCSMLYTDLSPSNLMTYRAADGQVHGMLIDWEGVYRTDVDDEIMQRVMFTISHTALRHMRAVIKGGTETFTVRDVMESLFYTLIYICSEQKEVPWEHCGNVLRVMESLKFTSIFGRFKVLLWGIQGPYCKLVLDFRNLLFQISPDSQGVSCRDVGYDDVLKLLNGTLENLGDSEMPARFGQDQINSISELVQIFDVDIEY